MKTQKEKIIGAGVLLIGVLFIFSIIGSALMYSQDGKNVKLPENTLLKEPLNEMQKNQLFNNGGSLIIAIYPYNCEQNCLLAKQTINSIKDDYTPLVYLYEQEGNSLEISLESFGLIKNYKAVDENMQKEIINNICNNLIPLWSQTKIGKKCLMEKALEEYDNE